MTEIAIAPPALRSHGVPGLHGVNPSAVIAALKDRARRRAAGDREPDGRKIGLVIEGGAMRGVYSGGGAAALAQMGLTDCFDEIYATSAGVMNAAYFLAGQADLGLTIYYENLVTKQFANPLRVWKVMDVDHVFDQVVTIDKPLDVDAVLAARATLFIAILDKRTGAARMLDTRATRMPLLRVLKAATAIPVLYNRTVEVDGRQCMDAGLAIPFPLPQAVAGGCTDVLVLLTRPMNYISPVPSLWKRWVFDIACARHNPRLRRLYARHHEPSRAYRDIAFGRAPAESDVNIATLCTDAPAVIQRTTIDHAELRDAALRYGRKTLRAFGVDPKTCGILGEGLRCED